MTPVGAIPGPRSLGHTSSSTSIPTSTPTLSSQARSTFQSSFDKFERTVRKLCKDDYREIVSTELQDVRNAAREIEQELAARQCLRNMRRIEPLLNGLDSYSKVVEVLCNGTPYLPWIWAPIKLLLKLAADYTNAFEKLITAYGRIAECLPRFDRLSHAIDNPDFQRVLAIIYSDILEFHRHAYKFFKKNGWKCFFNSSWGRFGGRFNCILDSLAKHTDLVDREANAFMIAETMQWRKEAIEETARREAERTATQLDAVLTWLNLETLPHCGQYNQDDILDRLANECYAGTTNWIVKHPKMRSWLKNDRSLSTLWLKGKPGAGKSTLCAKVAQFLRHDGHSTVLCCFYTYHVSGVHPRPSLFILTTLLSQLLRHHRSLCAYVYADFVAKAVSPSLQNLKQILFNLIPQVKAPRILVDGIDECVQYDQRGNPVDLNVVKDVVRDIIQLASVVGNNGITPKLLISSRDVLQLIGALSKKPTLSLDDEAESIRNAIRSFTHYRLSNIRPKFEDAADVGEIFKVLEEKIVQKSQEMFLWVRLILTHLEDDAYNLNDLETVMANMPTSLKEFYSRIIARLNLLNPQSRERATRILRWIVCARRPLRIAELQDAIVFDEDNVRLTETTKLPETIINLCKPLVQTLSNGTVAFVHFTVQEYLIDSSFIRLFDAEGTITTSLISYLEFSLNLIDNSIPHDKRTVDVGKGFYSLQTYAYEYWPDHLLSYATVSESQNVQVSPLRRCLDRLARFVYLYRNQYGGSWPGMDSYLGHPTLAEPIPTSLMQHAPSFIILSTLLRYRILARQHFKSFEHEANNESTPSPVPFALINTSYSSRVRTLLTSQDFPGLTASQLMTFKSIYGPFAFVCRFPSCSDPAAGFSSDELRIQHEKSHAPPLYCPHDGCTYTLQFTSQKRLRRHIGETHENVISRIPKNIRRKLERSYEQTPRESTHVRFFDESLHYPTNSASPSSAVTHTNHEADITGNQFNNNQHHEATLLPSYRRSIEMGSEAGSTVSKTTSLSSALPNDSDTGSHDFNSPDETYHTTTDYITSIIDPHNRTSPHGAPTQPHFADSRILDNHQSLLERHSTPRHNPSPPPISAYSNSPHQHSQTPSVGRPSQQPSHGLSNIILAPNSQSQTGVSQNLPPNPSNFLASWICIWCSLEFSQLSQLKTHEIQIHGVISERQDQENPLDHEPLCNFCRHNGESTQIPSMQWYCYHLEVKHDNEDDAVEYTGHLHCLRIYNHGPLSVKYGHRRACLDLERSVEELRMSGNEDEWVVALRQVRYHSAFLETLLQKYPHLQNQDTTHYGKAFIEKLLRPDRRAIPCTICAKAKTKCDKAVPSCSRCTAKGLPCEPRSTRRTNDSFRERESRALPPAGSNMQVYTCPWCIDCSYSSLHFLIHHERTSHNFFDLFPSLPRCTFCQEVFGDHKGASWYCWHLKEEHGNNEEATRYIQHLQALWENKRVEVMGKKYQCNWCSEHGFFNDLKSLMKHEITHNGFKEFTPSRKCMFCGTAYNVKSLRAYVMHIDKEHIKEIKDKNGLIRKVDPEAKVYLTHLAGMVLG